jgi:hypothetical protein
MKLRTIIVTATTAAVLASAGVAIAGATGNSPAPASAAAPPAVSAPAAAPAAAPADGAFATRVRARRLRLRKMLRGAGAVVTKAIGIDRATLRTDLASGKTIAQIATDNHVDPQTVIDALVAAAKTKLESAVTAGKLTSERAAKIEARLPARVTKLVNNWHPRRLRNTTAS